jgi:tyrosine-protein kinase Etk/Wzc
VLGGEGKELLDQLAHFEEQRIGSRLEVDSFAAVDEQLKRPSPSLEAHMMGEAKDDAVLTTLAAALAQRQEKLAEAEARYNAPAPEVQNQRADLDAQLGAVRNYVSTRLGRARTNLRMLDDVVGQYEAKLKTVPSAEVGLAQLTRESEVYGSLYSLLLRQQQEAALVKASTISKNRVLDPPEVPYRENLLRLGIGLGSGPLGVLLGALFVIVRRLTSGRLQDGADVRRHLGDVPILATIPRRIVRKGEHSAEYVEAFRTLRANMYGACSRERGNVVLFTSPSSGDGKTTCTYFLASLLSSAGRSVLVVDTGLERASRSRRRAADKGLAEVLYRKEPWDRVPREVQVSESCSFHAIGRGGDGTTDLLSSGAMVEFVEEVRSAYDFVLLEAPSYPAVSDTLVLAEMADCVVAVVRLEHTPRTLAEENVRGLSTVVENYGVVLNDMPP